MPGFVPGLVMISGFLIVVEHSGDGGTGEAFLIKLSTPVSQFEVASVCVRLCA